MLAHEEVHDDEVHFAVCADMLADPTKFKLAILIARGVVEGISDEASIHQHIKDVQTDYEWLRICLEYGQHKEDLPFVLLGMHTFATFLTCKEVPCSSEGSCRQLLQ